MAKNRILRYAIFQIRMLYYDMKRLLTYTHILYTHIFFVYLRLYPHKSQRWQIDFPIGLGAYRAPEY